MTCFEKRQRDSQHSTSNHSRVHFFDLLEANFLDNYSFEPQLRIVILLFHAIYLANPMKHWHLQKVFKRLQLSFVQTMLPWDQLHVDQDLWIIL